jgi:hypothetical protein
MAQNVWVLSVDLQTKTAAFATGMQEAANAARGSFKDIKQNADEMGEGVRGATGKVEYSMTEARHGVMMLGEEFGVHLPRGLTTFIASLGPVGAAMEAAFPFLAIILGATLLIEHLVKVGEAAEKAAEAGRTLDEDLSKGIIKAKEGMIDAEIEIRKLAGEPAWDLLNEKLKLEDANEGIENVNRLNKALQDLVKANGATSNWNPMTWGDHSDEMQNKAKALQEQMRGKSQTEQTSVLTDALQVQSKILEQMKGQTGVSEVQLKHQQAYVEFLRQETDLIQDQADHVALADQAKQGKDRADKIAKAEAEQAKLYETQQRGLEQRRRAEEQYSKSVAELHKKSADEAVREANEEYAATNAVMKEVFDQQKEQARLGEEMAKEEAEHTKKMAALTLQDEQNQTKEMVKVHKSRSEQVIQAQIEGENADYAAQMRAYNTELGALDKFSKDYEVHLRQLQDKEVELTKAHENKLTEIKLQAEEERNQRVLAAENKFEDAIASGMAKVLTGHESAAKMLTSLGTQVASGMIENALKSILANNMTKESDAAAAARKAYLEGQKIGGPAGTIVGSAMAAMAFASVMAFAEGGVVPGVEKGDVVPAMLTPGETVIPKQMSENLKNASNNAPKQPDIHVHHNATYNLHAIDTDGVRDMLDKHADTFTEHIHQTLRAGNH